jgi:hypothetical protein
MLEFSKVQISYKFHSFLNLKNSEDIAYCSHFKLGYIITSKSKRVSRKMFHTDFSTHLQNLRDLSVNKKKTD